MNDTFVKLIIVSYIHLEGEEILLEEPSVVLMPLCLNIDFSLMYSVALVFLVQINYSSVYEFVNKLVLKTISDVRLADLFLF